VAFVETAQMVLRQADSHLHRAADLSVIQFVVLSGLSSKGGSMTATEIARLTGTGPNNITMVLSRMRRKGLITTNRSRPDRRFLRVQLTDEGKAVLSGAMTAAWEFVNATMDSLTETDMTSMEKVLATIGRNVKKSDESSGRRSPTYHPPPSPKRRQF